MKTENILIIAGLGFIAYWLFKKNTRFIDIDPKMTTPEPKKEEKKTIYINLNDKKQGQRTSFSQSFYDEFRGTGYDTSKFSTVSPPTVRVFDNNL